MELGFAGKVVLVTGASRGIGRETAQQFSESGARVAINYRRNRQAAEQTLADVVERHDDMEGMKHEHYHGSMAAAGMFDTWRYEFDRPVSLKSLRQMVRRELPASIYRCKGIVLSASRG